MAYDSVTHANAGPLSMLGRLVADLRVRFARSAQRRHDYQRIMAELNRLEDRDLADLGISRADFRDIAAGRYGQPSTR
jgi:uncharacterized protein YjiS (DUF1127 family)